VARSANSRYAKRSTEEIQVDRVLTAQLYLQGKTQHEIAKIISDQYTFTITQQNISADLRAIQAVWAKQAEQSFDEVKQKEIARIDLIETRLWEQWERLLDAGKVVANPSLLTEIGRCVDRRLKIFGLDAMLKAEDYNSAISVLTRAGYQVSIPGQGAVAAAVESADRTVDVEAL
jgi:hypothetical protein